jgi:outer membrane immunogenic protein
MQTKVIALAGALVLISTAASAMSFGSSPDRFSWTGFYVGGNIGYGWSDDDGGRLVANTPGFDGAIGGGVVPLNFGTDPEGVLGGGQIGINWQATPVWVLGLEADLQASDIDDKSRINLSGAAQFFPTSSSATDALDWFGTVRGRIGYSGWFGTLVYFTGGYAYGETENQVSVVGDPSSDGDFHGGRSETQTGWTLGGGAEKKFADRWSAKLEYLYLDLDSTRVVIHDPQFPGDALDYNFDHTYHIVRLGINYTFGGERYEEAPLK